MISKDNYYTPQEQHFLIHKEFNKINHTQTKTFILLTSSGLISNKLFTFILKTYMQKKKKELLFNENETKEYKLIIYKIRNQFNKLLLIE